VPRVKPLNAPYCEHTKASGDPCTCWVGLKKIDGKFTCPYHAGKTDMKTIGKAGQAKQEIEDVTRGVESEDDELREKARKRLRKMIDDKNPNIAIRAATALAAYSPEKPINEQQRRGWSTEHAGLPIKELFDSLKYVAGDEAIRLLPSPGEILATRTDDQTSSVPSL
jgi:uncharacterized Zn finger protein (UPF0148 family)